MTPNENITTNESGDKLEVVIGVFDSHVDASRVAASLRGPDVRIQKVSRNDPVAPSELPEIVFDEIDELSTENVAHGAFVGGAIGAGSGLLLIGIPGLNIAAPLVGSLAGAWIGAVAGIDEANRGIELPNKQDYQEKLEAGKSFVVVVGDEATRVRLGREMADLGAEEVHQHPPVKQVLR